MASQFDMKVDPFAVQVAKEMDFTTNVLELIFAQRDDWENRATSKRGRWGEYSDGTWLFLQHLSKHSTRASGSSPATEYWLGSACRARTVDLPQQVTKDGVSPLDIDDDGGVIEHVAFLWEPKRKILWLQREASVGRTALAHYLRNQSGVTVGLVPIFKSDAPQQAKKMKEVKKIDVTYLVGEAKPKAKGFFKVVRELEEYGAARIEIKITPARGAYLDPSAREAVSEIADEVIANTRTVTKAKVWGDLDKAAENVLVDLLKARSEFSTKVDTSKSKDPQRLMKAVKNIWVTHRDDIAV